MFYVYVYERVRAMLTLKKINAIKYLNNINHSKKLINVKVEYEID